MKRHLSKIGTLLAAFLLLAGLTTPAFAAVTSLPDSTSQRTLNIYKYSPVGTPGSEGDGTANPGAATGRTPLENVEFEIYSLPEDYVPSESPDAAEVAEVKAGGTLVETIVTDEDGLATRNFGTGAQDGTYLIIEKANPAVDQPVDPFYVNIPLTSPDEDAWLYTVNVYPKNDIKGAPDVDKDVDAIDQEDATHDIGDIVTWYLRGDVPDDLYYLAADGSEVYAKNYSFTDELSDALTYQGNIVVKLIDTDGEENELTLDTDYVITGTDPVGTPGGTVVVKLTPAGMKKIVNALGTGEEDPEIRVSFESVINNTALVATDIPNNVKLDYTNSVNKEYEPQEIPEEERPEVHTGGLLINKFDKSNNDPLPGAVFKIARDATDAEKANAAVTKETITVGAAQKTVVFVDFYTTEAMDAAKADTVTTDNDGKAVMYGLAYGDYYLIETKAPDGYNLLSGPEEVEINAGSHLVANAIGVANSSKFELPVTGGAGVMMFTFAGVLLISVAVILIVSTKKKKAAAE